MANSGVYPLDATSEVGKLRLTIGDTESVPFDPVVPGYQDYQMFSDDELAAFLSSAGDSVLGGAGYAYLSLAAAATLESKSVKDFDIAIDTTKRAADYRALAALYFEQGGIVGGGDYFGIGDTGTDVPEYAEYFPYSYPLI